MTAVLPFTGERFTPESLREIWYEHWHRYAFALPLAAGRRVLDAACGEGYGAALLARKSKTVLGVDLAQDAISHARSRYGEQQNLRFERGDVTALDSLPDAAFDLIVSFETVEHVQAQEAMISGFARLLAPEGLLLLSSPDKATYSDATGFRNEHHVRELYRDQLVELLRPHFPAHRLYGQKLLFQSAIWPLDRAVREVSAITAKADGQQLSAGMRYAPLYFLALCARSEHHLSAAAVDEISLFGDEEESVYRHYEHEIRKNMEAGAVLADMQRRLAQAVEQSSSAPGWWSRILQRLRG